MRFAITAVLIASLPALLHAARRDHGPGTSGGGLQTASAETLKEGSASLSIRFDYTRFESLTKSDIETRTGKVGGNHQHFDTADWALLQTIGLYYGITDDLQLGYSFGWYRARDLQEGEIEPGPMYEFSELGDVSGTTDHWATLQARLTKGPQGQFAVLAGVKFPFGDDDEVGEEGMDNEPLEPSVQPGSSAFDVQVGAAYTRWLTERLAMDTSVRWIHPFEGRHFRIGDRVEVGAAFTWRLSEFADDIPRVSLLLEAVLRWQGENEEAGEKEVNSGGTTLFLSPGARVNVSRTTAFFVAPQFPVVQDLNDEQQETEFRVTSGISIAF